MSNTNSLDRTYKICIILVSLCALAWVTSQISGYFTGIVLLFGLSFLFTYILLAPVNLMDQIFQKLLTPLSHNNLQWLSQRLPAQLSRILSILTVYLLFGLLTVVVSVRFVPLAIDELYAFSNDVPKYVDTAENWALNQPLIKQYFPQEIEALTNLDTLSATTTATSAANTTSPKTASVTTTTPTNPILSDNLLVTPKRIKTFITHHIGGTFKNFLNIISSTLAGFIYTLTGLVLVFYFLLDGPKLKEGFVHMLPKESQQTADYFLSNVHSVMFGFVKAQLMLGIVTGFFMIIVYYMVGVPYAFFLGAFFAVAEILPVVGTWIGFTPGIIVLLFINPVKLIIVMGIVYGYQTIKDNIVTPKIMGDVMGLHPVIVIFSLLICAKVAGLVGILFAIPIASMVNVLIRFLQQSGQSNTAQ